MEGISVEYLDHMGSDNAIANVARVSFAGGDNWNGLPEGYTQEKAEKLIKYLAKHEHTSPFRHTAIVVRCKAPIFLARQLMKHQVGMSWSEVSRRYVDKEPEFFVPESWRSRPEGSLKQGSGGDLSLNDSMRADDRNARAIERCLDAYNGLLADGVSPEQARMVLPQSMTTEWVWTGTLMSYAHLHNLRIKENAQVEAQVFAEQVDKIIQPIFPIAWQALVDK